MDRLLDALELVVRDVGHVDRSRVVGEADFLRIGRPLRIVVEAGAIDLVLARRSFAVLIAGMATQIVFGAQDDVGTGLSDGH